MRWIIFFIPVLFFFTSCRDDEGKIRLNIFTIEDDKELGSQLHEEIMSKPADFPVLSESQYPEAYVHIRRITNTILNSGEVRYVDTFDYQTWIIYNDDELNAFAAPGGYMYVYTGLIKFLESEDELAGVMGHEIAHAARRHGTERLTRIYGTSLLLDIVLGEDRSIIADVAASLITLKYGRSQETEADMFSVRYLNPTEYDARGCARFFEKLEDESSGGSIPEFLSSHPSPDNRIEAIHDKWEELGSKEGERFIGRYQDFKNSLP